MATGIVHLLLSTRFLALIFSKDSVAKKVLGNPKKIWLTFSDKWKKNPCPPYSILMLLSSKLWKKLVAEFLSKAKPKVAALKKFLLSLVPC